MADPRISDVRFARASQANRARGLLGWASCRYGHLTLDGLAVRRTRGDRLVVTFPTRRDRGGRSHCLVRPIDAEAQREIERQIFAALAQTGAEARP